MADQWHYRILGEDFGPVPETTIRGLMADGTIAPSDDVRPDGAADWQRADSFAELQGGDVPVDADVPMDLDALLAPSESARPLTTKARANDWFYRSDGVQHGPFDFDTLFDHVAAGKVSRDDEILAPGGTDWEPAQSIVGLFPEQDADLDALLGEGAGPATAPSAASRQKPTPRWYYRVLNQELGPVDFESLVELVQEGNLRPDDDIRGEHETEWQRADTIVGLFPDQPSADADSVAASLDDEPDVDDHEEPEWYFKFDEEVMGPVTFGRLMRMAAKGRLQPSDPIRLTKLGAWMEAGSMVGLFPDEAPAEVAKSPPPSTVPDRPPTGDADDWAAAVLSEPAPEPPPQQTPEPVAAATPSPTPPSPGFSTPAAAPKRPAFTAPPKAKRSSPSFSMPSLPGNLGETFSNPLVLGGGAVALLAVGLFFVPWGQWFGKPADDLVVRINEIWGQVKPLYENRAPEAEWTALAAKVDPQLKEIAQEAKDRGAGPDRPALQIVYLVSGNYLPKVLEGKQATNQSQLQMIDNFMARADELTK